LVVNQSEQVIQFVASGIDDAQPVAREVVGIECSNQDTHHYADSHQYGHKPVILLLVHFSSGLI
jgi:hypothetical protein